MASPYDNEIKAKKLADAAFDIVTKETGNHEYAAVRAQLALAYAAIDINTQLRYIRTAVEGIREDRLTAMDAQPTPRQQ